MSVIFSLSSSNPICLRDSKPQGNVHFLLQNCKCRQLTWGLWRGVWIHWLDITWSFASNTIYCSSYRIKKNNNLTLMTSWKVGCAFPLYIAGIHHLHSAVVNTMSLTVYTMNCARGVQTSLFLKLKIVKVFRLLGKANVSLNAGSWFCQRWLLHCVSVGGEMCIVFLSTFSCYCLYIFV